MKKLLTNKTFLTVMLLIQFIPLLAFTGEAYDLKGQVWWLPAFLAVLVLVALFKIIVRGTYASWPWNLIGFAHGFNIISRLMMYFGHLVSQNGEAVVFNWDYAVIGVIAMLWSGFMLWMIEFPEVKNTMMKS